MICSLAFKPLPVCRVRREVARAGTSWNRSSALVGIAADAFRLTVRGETLVKLLRDDRIGFALTTWWVGGPATSEHHMGSRQGRQPNRNRSVR